jgi:hypothetical protein
MNCTVKAAQIHTGCLAKIHTFSCKKWGVDCKIINSVGVHYSTAPKHRRSSTYSIQLYHKCSLTTLFCLHSVSKGLFATMFESFFFSQVHPPTPPPPRLPPSPSLGPFPLELFLSLRSFGLFVYMYRPTLLFMF